MRGVVQMMGEQRDEEARHHAALSPSDLLHDLALRVLRLNPDRQNPESFLIAKDEVTSELRQVARRIGATR